ncbi:hypothetical protein [Tenacibaculum maritimum]|uniref:hypothetical protein n=1 Tax=Tenacibaculum maritimum TaxID=107401 RepID=UPI0010A307F0|nr:hypothetical protein [Tenacibaculum maritimum]QCD61101.1 hypothetical protein B9C57_00355 [Tenacibaculum maritimum]
MLTKEFIDNTKTKAYKSINIGLYKTIYLINIEESNEHQKIFVESNITVKKLTKNKGEENTLENVTRYLFPFLKKGYLYKNKSVFSFDNNQSGILLIDGSDYFFTEVKTLSSNFLQQYISSLVDNEDLYEPISIEDLEDSGITLNDEAKKQIKTISTQIDKLKESGQYLHILPILENFIKEERKTIDSTSFLSPIIVGKDLKISLPQFNDLEIKMSTLTKCIYLLFLNHKEGIYLNDLINYKIELIDYYKQLSSRDNYDKMLLSINKIIDLNSNEIYVHLSRIKSFFYKKFDKQIADNYIINGAKKAKKSISLTSDLIIWKNKHDNLF